MKLYIDSAIFDLDGTLVDSAPDILNCLRLTFSEYGIKPPYAAPLSSELLTPPLPEIVDTLAPGLEPGLRERLITRYRELYRSCGFPASQLFDGIKKQLEELAAAGIRLFVATNKPGDVSRQLLEKCGIWDLFSATIHPESGGSHIMDKSEMLATLVEKYYLAPSTSIMAGDGIKDILAARRLGLHSMAALYGYSPSSDLLAADPEICLPTPDWATGYYYAGGQPFRWLAKSDKKTS